MLYWSSQIKSIGSKVKHAGVKDLLLSFYIWLICNINLNNLGVYEHIEKLHEENIIKTAWKAWDLKDGK